MGKKQVMNVINSLARSQGFYGRLANSIYEAESRGEDLTPFFNQFKDCKDSVDVVMIIEC